MSRALRLCLSLILLSSLNIKCDSGGYEDAVNAVHADKASDEAIPVLGTNQQLLMLKQTSAAPKIDKDFTKNEDERTITIEKSKPITTKAEVKNNSAATKQPYKTIQTGKEEKSLSLADAKIDINVIVPPRSDNHVTVAVRDTIAANLNGVLTGSGALAGTNWKVIVINSSLDGADPQVVTSKYSNPSNRIKSMLRVAGSTAKQGSKYYNPVPFRRMDTIYSYKSSDAHARVFFIVADRNCFSTWASKFINGCGLTSRQWGMRKAGAKEIFEIYGLLRPDHQLCSALGCRPISGKCSYAGSATNINGNREGCYYDKSQSFTLKKVDKNGKATYPFCGKRGGLVNPCYKRSDSHKKYLGSWLSACSLVNSSCYRVQNKIYTPSAGKYHLFTAATTYDNSASLITQMASSIRAKLGSVQTSVGGVPFIDHAELNYTKSQVADVSVEIEANGSTTPLQQGNFTISYPNNKLKVTVTNPETNFPEGSTMIVTVTLAEPITSFPVPSPPGAVKDYHLLEDSISLKVNGSAAKFTMPDSKTIALNDSPIVGAEVEITAEYLQISYSGVPQAKQRTNDPTVCRKQSDGQAVDCHHTGDTLQFTNPAQIADGDIITVLQKQTANASKVIALGSGVVMESLKLTVGNASCDADSLAIVGMAIDIEASYASCEALKALQSGAANVVTITYDIINNDAEYTLLVPSGLLSAGRWNVRLKIAGEEKKPGVDYVVDMKSKTLTYLALDEIEPNTHAVVEFY